MRKKRPAAVLVIAIFHFLFAACGLCGLAGQALTPQLSNLGGGPGGGRQAEFQRLLMDAVERAPGYQVYQYGQMAWGVLAVLLLLAAGIGLLQLQPWARVASIVYAVASILNTLLVAGYYFGVLQSALEPVYQEMRRSDPAAANLAQMIGVVGIAVGILLQIAYGVAVLIVMLLPSVGKAFRRAPVRDDDRDEEEAEEDYYDDRYER